VSNGNRKTMTLNLSEAEMRILEELSSQKELSKTALLRQALRLYQLVDARLNRGDRLFLENELTKERAEIMVL
jgi:hypothetical protein